MHDGVSHDAFSQHHAPIKDLAQTENGGDTESEKDENEGDQKSKFEDQRFRTKVKEGSTINLFHQYLTWYTQHVVGDKPEEEPNQEATEPAKVEVIPEVIKQEPEKCVRAFGKGKTGFVDDLHEDTQETVPAPQVKEPIVHQDVEMKEEPIVKQLPTELVK